MDVVSFEKKSSEILTLCLENAHNLLCHHRQHFDVDPVKFIETALKAKSKSLSSIFIRYRIILFIYGIITHAPVCARPENIFPMLL